MNPDLAKLRSFCINEVAFEQLKQTWQDEIQPLEQEISQAHFLVEQHKALFKVIARLREPLELETIFSATAIEVRQFLKADRVGMFRFYADSGWNDGEFVSEDVDGAFVRGVAERVMILLLEWIDEMSSLQLESDS